MLTALPTASNHDGQPCEALDSCSRFLNSSITQGKAYSDQQKTCYHGIRIGRYLQCPPRKEPLTHDNATLSTRPSCSQPQTFRQGSRVPQNPNFSSRRWCQIAWEDHLIKSIIFEEQCRESLSIDETWQDNRASRENKGEDGEKKMRPPPLSAKEEGRISVGH